MREYIVIEVPHQNPAIIYNPGGLNQLRRCARDHLSRRDDSGASILKNERLGSQTRKFTISQCAAIIGEDLNSCWIITASRPSVRAEAARLATDKQQHQGMLVQSLLEALL